jgi:DNA-binding IclR family transcriptional regulator
MGRRKKNVDELDLLKMRGEGKSLREISKKMGVSVPTLSRRVAYLQYHEGILTKYRQIQGLHLTELQAKLLSAIDLDHIEKASLVDIANAFYVITKLEKSIQGKESGKGLVDHILALENQE